jgi:hypothetical protein
MSTRFHSRWLDFVPERAVSEVPKVPEGAFVTSGTSVPGRFRDTNWAPGPISEAPTPSIRFVAPAACPRCGEPTAPLFLVRADGSRAVLCRRGHWTTAHQESEP